MTAKVICGDALVELARLADEGARFDALLTDPPYCSGGVTPAERRKSTTTKYYESPRAQNVDYDDAQDQVAFMFTMRSVFSIARKMLSDTGYAFCFCDWRQLPAVSTAMQSAGFIWRGVIVWDKRRTRPIRGAFTPVCEYVVYGTRGFSKSDKFVNGLISVVPPAPATRFHRSEKPVEALEKILGILPDTARAVVDPFCGSGSVGVAAKKLGLDFTGIEISEYYANVAKQRLGITEK